MQFEAGQSVTSDSYILFCGFWVKTIYFMKLSSLSKCPTWNLSLHAVVYLVWKSLPDTLLCSQSLSTSQGFLSLHLDSYGRIEMGGTTLHPLLCLLLTVPANVSFCLRGDFFSAVFSRRWNLQGHHHNGRDWNHLVRHNS